MSPFQRNLPVLRRCHPKLESICARPSASRLRVEASRCGLPTLVVENGGSEISLHSRMNPRKEGEDLAGRLAFKAGQIPVFLGLGLGYHVLAALSRWPGDAPLAVVEPSADIFCAALNHMDLRPLLERPNCLLLIGSKVEDTLKALSRFQVENGFAGISVAPHGPSLRRDPDFFGPVTEGLSGTGRGLAPRLIYPRFKREALRILIFNTGYYLVKEITRAAEALGHRVRHLSFTHQEYGSEDTIRDLLTQVAEFKPDFVLTLNHLGFDDRGVLADMLAGMHLPFASWFVDSPRLILGASGKGRRETGSIFLWDGDYQAEVKALGYENVHFLPLATDHTLFKPRKGLVNPLSDLAAGLSFVGDSMVGPVEKYQDRVGLTSELKPLVEAAARKFAGIPDRTPATVIGDMGLDRRLFNGGASPQKMMDLEALLTFWATKMYRFDLIETLAPLGPTIVGDPGWSSLVDERFFNLHPPVDYYTQLPWFYPLCRINFNATSLQMKTGLNQRVFDVPACGAFLLTDYREQIEGLFEVGREVICYGQREEALDLARYYLDHETERRRTAERGLARVLAEHTYQRRLARLIDHMRQDYTS